MPSQTIAISLMLMAAILSPLVSSFAHGQVHHSRHIGHWRLAERDQEPPKTFCPASNETTIIAGSSNSSWTILCQIDYVARDIYPFILAKTFEECLQHCDDYNSEHDGGCAAIVFAPERIEWEDSCYLKSSANDGIAATEDCLVAAVLMPTHATSSSQTWTAQATPLLNLADQESLGSETDASLMIDFKLLGASENDPATQYVMHPPIVPQKLASDLVQPGINLDLVTKYPLAPDTGSWTSFMSPFDLELANMSLVPRVSRDGGRGGNINGTHIFMFCDTATYGTEESAMGYMNGFVSSSAAVAKTIDPDSIDHLVLRDTVGQWQDDVGRLRGWIEMTTGEQAFNIEISGNGYRYAVWPDSSFISYNASHALIYAPVVYVEVNMTNQKWKYESLGNSLILIHVDPVFGPHADRVKSLIFASPEIEWGSLAGLRAWGPSGNGTMEGMIYLFGGVDNGVLVAKVAPDAIEDRSAYQYWDGDDWSSEMQHPNSTAFMIEQRVMNFDIFYAPYWQTFFMVYLTPDADNTFYLRYLLTNNTAEGPVIPPWEPNGDPNYCERILNGTWSEQLVLFKVPTPQVGYAYAGGAHLGYFGTFDLSLGGTYLLLTWTEHTQVDPTDPASGYAHRAAWTTVYDPKRQNPES